MSVCRGPSSRAPRSAPNPYALGEVLEAGEQLHALQGRPSGVLRINAARISVAMILQPLLAGFLAAHPGVQIEISNDEGYVDIVEKGFDVGICLGESVQKERRERFHVWVRRSLCSRCDRNDGVLSAKRR
jgi:DNA-binding transcriptional LysR family regulator